MRRALLMLILVVAGCGDPLVKGTYKPPYYTFQLELQSQLPKMPDSISVALLWWSNVGTGPAYASQLVTLRLQSPLVNNVDINALPQSTAIWPVSPELIGKGVDPYMHWGYGTLVAYADNNGNGTLDIDPSDGTKSPDLVLGASERIKVFDLAAGRPAPPQLFGALPTTSGFSLIQEPARIDPPLGSCDVFDHRGHKTELCKQVEVGSPAPAKTPIVLTLTAEPKLQRYACASFLGPFEYPDYANAPPDEICDSPSCKYCRGYTCLPDVPPANAMSLECNSDNTAYSYKICSDDPSACGTTFCHFGHGARLPTDPIPAGWPCH